MPLIVDSLRPILTNDVRDRNASTYEVDWKRSLA